MTVECLVLKVAERQHGVVSRRQVGALGGDSRFVARRVAAGRWQLLTPRVIRIVGSTPGPDQQLMASVLDAGASAVASHEAAAWLWKVPGFTATDVVIRPRSHGATADLGHRPKLVLPHHRTEVRGIPCTTLPRTIFDLAAVQRPGRTRAVVRIVANRSPAMLTALHRMLPELAQRGRTGITVMRQILADNPIGSTVPESGNEARFEELCRNAGIRGLERQVDVGGHSWLGRVDYLLRPLGLIIEIDGELNHCSPGDRARDAERDAAMLAAGFRKVLRVTAEDLWRRPWFVVEQVRAAIAELEAA